MSGRKSGKSMVKRATAAPAQLTPKELQKAKRIAKSIKIRDTAAVLGFGVEAQRGLTEHSREVLRLVRAKDVEPVSRALTDLVVHVKKMKAGSPPVKLGGIFDAGRRFIARYEKVGRQIDKIVERLEGQKDILLKDIVYLDLMYRENAQLCGSLRIYIAAGEMKVVQLKGELETLRSEAKASGDSADAQAVQDLAGLITRLERRIHNLRLTRTLAVQSAPQIRLVQAGDHALVEKVQSSIMTTVPLWMQQLAMAVSLLNQKRTLDLQRRITETTDRLIRENSQMLRENAVQIATEMERGVVSVETLTKANEELIGAIEGVVKVQQEGRKKRIEAERVLSGIEAGLKQKLIAAKAGS